jgi:hypothetical protein
MGKIYDLDFYSDLLTWNVAGKLEVYQQMMGGQKKKNSKRRKGEWEV